MRFSPSMLFGALAFASVVTFAAVPPAVAQAAAPQVVVVDFGRLYGESLAGKDAQAKIKAIADGVAKELDPEGKALEAEQAALGPKFQGKSQDQIVEDLKKDKALATKYDAFIKRADAFLQLRQLRGQELQATSEKALSDVLNAALPDVNAAMAAKNATVVVERRQTITVAPAADITADVINRFNGRVKSVPVTKIDLTKQQQQ